MTTATARTYEYRGHFIEVNAFNTGRWNGEATICGPLTDAKPHVEVIRSHASSGLAERAAREWARRWIDLRS